MRVIHPPLEHVFVNFGRFFRVVQPRTEVTVRLGPVLAPVPYLVVILPPKIFGKKFVRLVNFFEIFDKFFRGRKVQNVDGRMWRSADCREISSRKCDRYDAVLEDVEVLLGDVVLADRVLEGQVVLVVLKNNSFKCLGHSFGLLYKVIMPSGNLA